MVETKGAYTWIGQSVPQPRIDERLIGATRYVDDVSQPRLLEAAIFRSPVPHGVLRGVNVERARALPGVRAIITGKDTPGLRFGPYAQDWEILARDRLRFAGAEIAAVAATSKAVAQRAVNLIEAEIDSLPEVSDSETKSPSLWDEKPDNIAYDYSIERGDIEGGFACADLVLESRYTTNRIYHAYIEPLSVIAEAHPDGSFTFIVPTHIPYKARLTYAAGLGVDVKDIRIIVPPIGGSFGAKYEMLEPLIAACLSRAAGAPVRITYPREEDARFARPRPPFEFRHKLGLTAEGRFVARETEVVGVAGARLFWSPAVLATAIHRVDSLYDFGAMRGQGKLVYTNEPPTTCMRGFGNAEALFGIEQMIDEAAETLNMDPFQLRLQNIYHKGDRTLHGWYISSSELPKCLERVTQMSGFSGRRAISRASRGRTGVRRGMGLAIGHHVSGYKPILADFDGSSAIVKISADGSVTLLTGEPDIGQGQSAVFAQIVAEVLGCSPEDVDVPSVDSRLSPDSVGTLASRATTIGGQAAENAALAAREKLSKFLATRWNMAAEGIDWKGDVAQGLESPQQVSLSQAAHWYSSENCGLPILGEGVYRPPTEWPDDDKYGNPSAAYPFAAHVAEVEVDCETGRVRVTNYWAVHDSGEILNPSTARGQVLGAIAQGIGWALMEDVVYRDGKMQNPSFLDYRIPGAGDMPDVEVEFVRGFEPNGPFGAKSLAEVAINPTVAAIANAIHDATGVRFKDLPIGQQVVWERIHSDNNSAL